MVSDVDIVNIGLGKLAASRISVLNPPVTPIERFVGELYPELRRRELSLNRWNFALEYRTLTKVGAPAGDAEKPYAYMMPNDAIRPIRTKNTEWDQIGKFLYSAYSENFPAVQFVIDKPEGDFDPLFVDVLACRVAIECAEYTTQSNKKKEAAMIMYDAALDAALRVNAVVKGSESFNDVEDRENSYSWTNERAF